MWFSGSFASIFSAIDKREREREREREKERKRERERERVVVVTHEDSLSV